MPKKIAQLLMDLAKAGYVRDGGSGSHRKYKHPSGHIVLISVHRGDAKRYQERDVEDGVRVAEEWKKRQK